MSERQKDPRSPRLTPQELRQRVARAREERRRREEKAALARRMLDEALEDCRRAQEALDRETDLLLRVVEGAGAEAGQHEPPPPPSPLPSASAPASMPEGVPPMAHFPTPPGAVWEEVRLRFRDCHTASIGIGDVVRVFHYSQMGLADRRDSSPTVEWQLLRDFATNHGLLHWGSRQASRKQKKRRERLARGLRAFFGIEGDPFELTEDRQGWQTRFSVSPEG